MHDTPISTYPKSRTTFLLLGLLLVKLGTSIYMFGLPWLAYDLTGSSLILGTVFAVEMLPYIVLLPIGGVVIDRMNRRWILIGAESVRFFLIFSIPILHWVDALTIPYIFTVSIMLSICSFFSEVAFMATIPQIVPNEDLTKTNGQIQFAENTANLLGPMLAGLLVGLWGTYPTLLINSFSFLVMVICLLSIRFRNEESVAAAYDSVWNDIKDGFRYLWNKRDLRAIAWVSILCNLGMGIVLSTLIYYLRDILLLDELRSGVVYSAIGIFGIVSSLITEPLTKKVSNGHLLCILLFTGGGIGSFLFALFPNWFAALLGIGIWAGCLISINIILNTHKQRTVDNKIFGRIEGILTSIAYVSFPVAGLLGGALISSAGSIITYLIAAGSVISAGMVAFYTDLRKI